MKAKVYIANAFSDKKFDGYPAFWEIRISGMRTGRGPGTHDRSPTYLSGGRILLLIN
jgi:hypothetical protein